MSFSTELLFSWSAPVCSGTWDYSSPDGGLSISFVELHEILLCPVSQPVNVPLNDSTTIWCYQPLLIVCIICKLTEGVLCTSVQVINGDIK